MHKIPKGEHDPNDIPVRFVLAAYMIAFRPSNVIEVMTEIAKQLYKASAPLLETFEEICRAIVDQRGPPFVLNDGDLLSDALKKFTKLLFYYIKCFKGRVEAAREPA